MVTCRYDIPESSRPHRVPDVRQAREPGVPQDVLHHGGQVVLSQLVDGEAPEGAVVGIHEARGVDVIPTVPVRQGWDESSGVLGRTKRTNPKWICIWFGDTKYLYRWQPCC